MELKDFVSATLQQILQGIRDAQGTEGGGDINAEGAGIPAGTKAYSGGTYGSFTLVEFDVSVTAETSGKGGVNLSVFSVGAKAGGEHKATSANRISFAVPVRLPDGDTARAADIRRKNREAMDRGRGRGGNWSGI